MSVYYLWSKNPADDRFYALYPFHFGSHASQQTSYTDKLLSSTKKKQVGKINAYVAGIIPKGLMEAMVSIAHSWAWKFGFNFIDLFLNINKVNLPFHLPFNNWTWTKMGHQAVKEGQKLNRQHIGHLVYLVWW